MTTSSTAITKDLLEEISRFYATTARLSYLQATRSQSTARWGRLTKIAASVGDRPVRSIIDKLDESTSKQERDTIFYAVRTWSLAEAISRESVPARQRARFVKNLQGFGVDGEQALVRRLHIASLSRAVSDAEQILRLTHDAYFSHAETSTRSQDLERRVSSVGPAIEEMHVNLGLRPWSDFEWTHVDKSGQQAFCAAATLPREIFVLTCGTGESMLRCILHETSHAQRFLHVDPDLPFSAQHLGDCSASEGFAFLFERLVEEESFTRDILGTNNFVMRREAAISTLKSVRRVCASILAQREFIQQWDLNRSIPPEPVIERIWKAHLGLLPSKSSVKKVVEDHMFGVEYIRGWLFEYTARHFLRTQFGCKWYASAEAGKFLKDTWKSGSLYDASSTFEQASAEAFCSELLARVGGSA